MFLLLPKQAVYSLELSLESNKAESGTVGYVDIDLVFKKCSLTNQQRDSFRDKVKEKEDFINDKKKGLFALKAEISQLKQEKEFALRLPLLIENQKMLNQLSSSLAAATEMNVSTLTGSNNLESSTSALTTAFQGESGELNVSTTNSNNLESSTFALTTAFQVESGELNVSTTNSNDLESSTSTLITALQSENGEIPQNATSTTPTEPKTSVFDMPGMNNVPLDYFKFSVSTSAAVIENIIVKKSAELKKARKEIEIYRSQTELELLDYENRQTEIILGKIYMILKELAIKEGVSVVIDKRSILFGNFAVDLTDKLLMKLEEEPL
ncbi:MAG: OmpH family outer membrane protein [Elusimicrobia bacterium]|nr:OmpH family outer membrane protein [Elusimicrobiota bacterium]